MNYLSETNYIALSSKTNHTDHTWEFTILKMVSFQIGKGKKLFEISPKPYGGEKSDILSHPSRCTEIETWKPQKNRSLK